MKLLQARFDFFVSDFALGVTDAFVKSNQMRGGEQAGLDACLGKDGLDEGTCAAFAIGASHMDELEPCFGVIEDCQQAFDVVEPEFDAVKLGRIEPGKFRIHRDEVRLETGSDPVQPASVACWLRWPCLDESDKWCSGRDSNP